MAKATNDGEGDSQGDHTPVSVVRMADSLRSSVCLPACAAQRCGANLRGGAER